MIVLIKYNAGNNFSVMNALKRLNVDFKLSDEPEDILQASKVIFPGVGAAKPAMEYLKQRGLDQLIPKIKVPFLGICLGQQLLCKHSEEGDTKCLGVFDAKVKRFDLGTIVPHMGWNNFKCLQSPLFKGIELKDDVFFVHSFYTEMGKDCAASTEYGIEFSSAMQKNNFYATQFHLEKSGLIGEKILKNFLEL